MANLSQPTPLDLTGNIAENWKRFKQRFELYNVASGMSLKDEKSQTSMLLHVIGDGALDIYNTFVFAQSGDSMKLEKVLDKFESYCMPKRNVTYERHKFFTRSQHVHETIDQYATELRNRAQSCEFGDLTNSLIQDRIICGMLDNSVRERLLRQENLTLDKTLQLCRAAETTRAQAKELSSKDDKVSVDALGSRKQSFPNRQRQNPWHCQSQRTNQSHRPSQGQSHRPSQSHGQGQNQRLNQNQNHSQSQNFRPSQKTRKSCGRCGNWHGRNFCPAQGQTCKQCGRMNHFAKCCRTSVGKVVNELQNLEVDDRDEDFLVNVVESGKTRDEWKVNLMVNDRQVEFKLDTGAQTNLISESVYQSLKPKPKLHPARVKLTGYSGAAIPVKGRCFVQVEYKGSRHNIDVLVTPGYVNRG